jgi:hypothetical protein
VGICKRDKCMAPAVGGHMVAPNHLCRPHLLEEVAGELVECEVLAGKVAGLDGVSVERGGTVRLHPGETHIDQLEGAGIVRRKPAAKKQAAATS